MKPNTNASSNRSGQIARRHFSAPIETIEGAVKSASPGGLELSEYPGRTFRFSSVSISMADLVAEELGRSNRVTRAQAVENANLKRTSMRTYLADRLTEGTHVQVVIPKELRTAQRTSAPWFSPATRTSTASSWSRFTEPTNG
ncbi:MAG TPA: hypothetical protein VGR96_17920 [Acidobacteriaceae bacterium]|nr:hypothetical protein [Acidobacteriaceae bacterium]